MTNRLRADLVVGGLWPGAPCLVRVGDMGAEGWRLDPSRRGRAAFAVEGNPDQGVVLLADSMVDKAWLRLDDPLGLGLAGLAARVAERLGIGPWPLSRPDMPDWSLFDLQVEAAWRVFTTSSGRRRSLPSTSTYLALTDRLCAAVGLELAREVARWERLANGDWVLRTEACSVWFTADPVLRIDEECGIWGNVLALADIGPDDWQAALEACLQEVTPCDR